MYVTKGSEETTNRYKFNLPTRMTLGIPRYTARRRRHSVKGGQPDLARADPSIERIRRYELFDLFLTYDHDASKFFLSWAAKRRAAAPFSLVGVRINLCIQWQ